MERGFVIDKTCFFDVVFVDVFAMDVAGLVPDLDFLWRDGPDLGLDVLVHIILIVVVLVMRGIPASEFRSYQTW